MRFHVRAWPELVGCAAGLLLVGLAVPPAAGQTPEAIGRARAAYEAGECGKVIVELEGALVHASNYTDRDLSTIHLYLGLCYLGLGRTDRANEAFSEAVRLDPGVELAPSQRTPDAVAALGRARQEIVPEVPVPEPSAPPGPVGEAIVPAKVATDRTRWGGIWRSCLVPGWGQFYGGRRIRGYAFLTGEAASLLAALYATHERNRILDDSGDARRALDLERANDLRNDSDSWKSTRETLLTVAGGIWLLNLLESALNDPGAPREERRALLGWGVSSLTWRPDGWAVRINRRF